MGKSFDFKPNIIIFFHGDEEYIDDLYYITKQSSHAVPVIRYLTNLTNEYTKGGVVLAKQTITGWNQYGNSINNTGEGYTKIENNTLSWYVEVIGPISNYSYPASTNQLNNSNSIYYYIAF